MGGLFYICCILLSSVMSSTSAEVTIRINATLGEEVTLRLPERGIKADVIDVAWIRGAGIHFATTTPDGHVSVRDDDYKGRLRGSNASLTITDITMKDQGVYSANVLFSNEDTYIQKYNIRILARSHDKATTTGHKTSMLDPCSMSCRRDHRDVILTCDQTRQDITAVYDPDTCTCAPWNADCAPCVLEQYCRKALLSGRRTLRFYTDDVVLTVVGFLLVVCGHLLITCWRKGKLKNCRCFGLRRSIGNQTISL